MHKQELVEIGETMKNDEIAFDNCKTQRYTDSDGRPYEAAFSLPVQGKSKNPPARAAQTKN